MPPYGVFLIAFGVAGLAWLFAGWSPSTARKLWSPVNSGMTAFRLGVGALTLYVLLTAGGIAAILGLVAAFFAGLHLYYTRPDRDLPHFGIPGPFRWFMSLMDRIERLLIGR